MTTSVVAAHGEGRSPALRSAGAGGPGGTSDAQTGGPCADGEGRVGPGMEAVHGETLATRLAGQGDAG
jgi:hypothetical protein